MAFSHRSADGDKSPSIQSALGDIITHGHQLLVNRLDLMQVELRAIGEHAVMRGVNIALAALLTFSGFVLLTAAAVMGLSLWMGEALALTTMGTLYLAAGLICVGVAKKTQPVDVTTSFVPDASTALRGRRDAN